MSVEESLQEIISDGKPESHRVTKYRRRDLRNGLASRLGIEKSVDVPPKKRLRISKIPLDVSDFTIEDLIKEYTKPVYSKVYDTKEDRGAIFEFEDPKVMDTIVEEQNGRELNGTKIQVEIYELERTPHRRRNFPTRRGRGSRHGNRYPSNPRPQPTRRKNREENKPNLEQLDAELDAYMKQD